MVAPSMAARQMFSTFKLVVVSPCRANCAVGLILLDEGRQGSGHLQQGSIASITYIPLLSLACLAEIAADPRLCYTVNRQSSCFLSLQIIVLRLDFG
ncbi:hypothetical protein [Desulfosediminicola sp.]|uniref:hypothetical protein n=1 Tax=Desulfosediminicola sp. TaxID=2886825 RepID=UPI003AF1E4C5